MKKGITTKQFFTQVNLLYFSQPAVLMLFFAVVFTLVYNGSVVVNPDEAFGRNMLYFSIALLLAGLAGAHFLYNMMLAKIEPSLDLKQKTAKYLPPLLIRSALLEAAGMFACVAFFLTGQTFLMAIPLLIIGVFILIRPTKSSIIEDLKLNAKDAATLNNPDAIVGIGNQ